MKELRAAHKAEDRPLSQEQLDALAARQGEKAVDEVELDLSQEQRDVLKSLSASLRVGTVPSEKSTRLRLQPY